MLTVNRPTALGLSALLHVGLLCAGLIVWPGASKIEPIHVTPITLMTAPQVQPLRAAEQAPAPQEEQTPTPEPVVPPAPPPPQPKPKPAPKAPTPPPAPPKAQVAAKPAPKAPTLATKVATTTAANPKPVNLDNLAKSLAQTAPSTPAPSAAPAGPTQAERDAAQRLAEGQARAATANALQAIGAKIADNWRVNCSSASERNVTVVLRLDLSPEGGLIKAQLEKYPSLDAIPDPGVRAAAISAISAAQAAAPFSGLPQQTYGDWRSKTYEFQASQVCADRLGKR